MFWRSIEVPAPQMPEPERSMFLYRHWLDLPFDDACRKLGLDHEQGCVVAKRAEEIRRAQEQYVFG